MPPLGVPVPLEVPVGNPADPLRDALVEVLIRLRGRLQGGRDEAIGCRRSGDAESALVPLRGVLLAEYDDHFHLLETLRHQTLTA